MNPTEILASTKVEYLNKDLYNQVKEEISKKIPASYVRSLQVLREYKKRGGRVKYNHDGGGKPSSQDVQKNLKKEHVNKIRRKAGKSKASAIYEIDMLAAAGSDYNSSYNEILTTNLNQNEKQELISIHNEIYNQ